MGWFHVAEYEPGLHLVAEPGHVSSWLVHGSERSVLVDTGLGLVSIGDAIAPVARGTVVVVNSHADFDHVGGNAEFEERLIHVDGAPRLAEPVPRATLEAYAGAAAGMREAWEALDRADREGFHLLGPDETVRPWPPAGVALHLADRAAGRHGPPAGRGQDTIELGDRTLVAIHTPGHAPDHVCLLDERAGILFAQDQAYYGPHLLYFEHSDLDAWVASARLLAGLASEIRVVYTAHCLRPALPPRILRELARAGEEVAAGEARLSPGTGLFGEPVLEADFGHFSLQVAPKEPG